MRVNPDGPVLGRTRPTYELAERSRAIAHGGIGAVLAVAGRSTWAARSTLRCGCWPLIGGIGSPIIYITNDHQLSADQVVAEAGHRCDQEHLIAQLEAIRALNAPANTLDANRAYMTMAVRGENRWPSAGRSR